MQKRLSELKAESDFMPEVGNNRDGLPESTFNAIYADSSSTEYIQRMNEIREAIEAKPIFQGLNTPPHRSKSLSTPNIEIKRKKL